MLILVGDSRVISYMHGFGLSSDQLELLALEIERTPTTRFSKVTGKTSAPCTPAARTRAKGAVRAS